MAGDDTTPDPLFKNVPRRPRSAASAYASWPRKEEPDDGDPSGGSVSNNASPPATSTGGGAEHVPPAKKHRLVPIEHVPRAKKHRLAPIEEPEPEDAKDRGGVGALDRHGILLGGMPPALSKNKDKQAAAAAASASSSEPEPAVDWAGNERWRRKGKTPVVNEDDACAAVARRPPGSGLGGGGKLLGDAIRSHGSTAAVAGFKPSRTKPKKPAKKKDRTKPKKKAVKMKDSGAWFWCGMGRGRMSSAGSDVDCSFDRIGVVSDRLRTTLRGLGVAPVRVYGRLLSRCDRDVHQTRLLMSCKRWRAGDAEFPLCAFLTAEERKEAHGEGLPLMAYDRGGEPYEITFRFLGCNVAYRLINKWGDFLRHNGLVVGKDEPAPVDDDVMFDLWLFRTPGGKVGLVMLHYRRGDAAHADAALDVVEQKRRQLMKLNNNGDAGGTGGNANDDDDADAVMEDVVLGDANEDAGVKGEVAAAAPAPSSPSSEPNGGGAVKAAEDQASGSGKVPDAPSSLSKPDGDTKAAEEQAGALGEVAGAPSSTSSELHGGAGRRSDEVTAPLSLLGGDGTEEEQQAGGALMVMVLEVEAATLSTLDSNAGGAANEVAAPPSSPEAGGGAAMMATEDEAAAELALAAAARSWKVTKHEFQAAQALVMLSKANSIKY